MNKKTIYALFLVSLVAVFAYMVMASFDGRGVSVISPTVDNNYSGVLILNATINDSGTDIDNATNVTFFFYSDTDGSLVYNVTFENSSGNQSRFNTSVNTVTLLADDTYNITVNATNASKDNIENSSITGVLIDNTAPTITINTANNSFLGTSVTSLVFNVTVADSGSGVLTTVDLQNNSETNESASQVGTAASREFNRTVVLSELATGSNTLTVVANDTITAANGGINTNDSESIVVWVDNVSGPIIELNSTQYLQNYTWTTDTTPTLYFNFSDDYSPNASCELFVDETGYGVTDVLNNTATGLTANDSLSIGVHSWYVNCTDLGGFLNSSLENNPAFTLDVVSPITVTTPTNNSWTNGTEAGNVSFIFSFVSGLTNGNNTNDNGLVSCELYIENETGSVFNPAGVNTTALNDTSMTFTNNQSLVNGQATNWTINCSFNGTDITQAVNNDYFILNVDNATPTTPTLTSSASSSTSLTIAVSTSSDVVSCVDTDPDTSI